MPKVERSGGPASPTVSAKPAKVDGTVRYSDGLSLKVTSIDFATETGKGPGSFPGRAYAVLTLQAVNNSDRNLSMETVVVTVLDKQDKAVSPVYTEEADVSDFSGTLKSGRKTSGPITCVRGAEVIAQQGHRGGRLRRCAYPSAVFRGNRPKRANSGRALISSRAVGAMVAQVWQSGGQLQPAASGRLDLGLVSGSGLLSLCLSFIFLATAVASGMVGDSLVILDRRDRAIRGGLQFWAWSSQSRPSV